MNEKSLEVSGLNVSADGIASLHYCWLSIDGIVHDGTIDWEAGYCCSLNVGRCLGPRCPATRGNGPLANDDNALSILVNHSNASSRSIGIH